VNARDAMPQGGRLTIQTGEFRQDAAAFRRRQDLQPGRYAVLSVTDTGCGMDEEVQRRIFEPFFTTKDPGRGTGLGLSMAYGIITQCGGAIRVESTPGKGATFRIYLPITEEAPRAAEPTLTRAVPERGHETILVVEDEQQVRDLAVRVLESRGYRVLSAADGQAALRLCHEHDGPLDLLLTDVIMPELNGRQLADRILRLRPGIRVVYMSGYIDDAIVSQGQLPPGTAFVAKPFTLDALAAKVRQALDGEPADRPGPPGPSESDSRAA